MDWVDLIELVEKTDGDVIYLDSDDFRDVVVSIFGRVPVVGFKSLGDWVFKIFYDSDGEMVLVVNDGRDVLVRAR